MASPVQNPWIDYQPAPENDLERLMPGDPLGHGRFPTLADAMRNRDRVLSTLKKQQVSLPHLGHCVDVIESCVDDEGCGRPYCHICMRLVGRWAGGEMVRALRPLQPDLAIVTLIHNADVRPAGRLSEIDLRRMHDRLRRRLGSFFPGHHLAMGGFEVALRNGIWVPHYHLAMPASADDLAGLMRMKEYDGKRSVHRVPVRDLPAQLSYCVKFVTYHRPAAQCGSRRARAVPLPAERLAELVLWLERYEPQQLLFMQGVRRAGRGSALVLL